MVDKLLYLHIPFCDSKCHYCSFNSYSGLHKYKKEYMEQILEQAEVELSLFLQKNQSISSVFVGGGTPSTVEAFLYKPFFDKITPFLEKNCEITFEANPNSASLQWLDGIKKLGANRISFGVQSFNEQKLKFLGRSHTKEDAIWAPINAKKMGFENISIDLMYDCAIDTQKILEEDLKIAFGLPITHVSAYSLTIEDGSLFEGQDDKKLKNRDFGEFVASKILKYGQKKGFKQYEISNYGSNECKHNVGYWEHKEYLGIGAGAVGFYDNKRHYPHNNINEYIKNPIYKTIEKLNFNDLKFEKIFLGFRSRIGVDCSIFDKNELERINILLKEKKIEKIENHIFCKDFFIADEIVLFIMN